MKKWKWSDAITWKDYGILCLVAFVVYLPIMAWWLWQYYKQESSIDWCTTTVIPIGKKNEEEES